MFQRKATIAHFEEPNNNCEISDAMILTKDFRCRTAITNFQILYIR